MRWGAVPILVLALAWGGFACRSAGPSPKPASLAAKSPDSTAQVASPSPDSAEAIFSAAKLPIPELGYNAREGRAVYRHYCSNCHGDEGKGDGFNAYNLDPKPQSLADSTFQASHSDADLVTAIRSGGPAVGLSTGMPPWGRTLSPRQVQNVVDYLRTLPKVESASP
jgi:mono/diheme cytochrome c family protein